MTTNDPNGPSVQSDPSDSSDPSDPNDPNDLLTGSFADDRLLLYGIFPLKDFLLFRTRLLTVESGA